MDEKSDVQETPETPETPEAPKPRKGPVKVSAQDVEIYRLVTEDGVKYGEISEQFEISEATVGRVVKRVREYLRDLRDRMIDEDYPHISTPSTAVAPASPPQGEEMQLIPNPGENVLDAVSDFAKISRASASSGVVLGCAFSSIHESLSDPNISDDEGLAKMARGMVALGGFVYGAVKSTQRLSGDRERKEIRRY